MSTLRKNSSCPKIRTSDNFQASSDCTYGLPSAVENRVSRKKLITQTKVHPCTFLAST